jgi:uncharacterized membrane protein
MQPEDLINDGFGAIARDGAGNYEVQHRLQATLAGLMKHPDDGLSRAAGDFAVLSLRRAMETMDFAPDRTRLAGIVSADLRAQVQKYLDQDEAVN